VILFTGSLDDMNFGRLRHLLARMLTARLMAQADLLALPEGDPQATPLALTYSTFYRAEQDIEMMLVERSEQN
jgi:hypothetical protein